MKSKHFAILMVLLISLFLLTSCFWGGYDWASPTETIEFNSTLISKGINNYGGSTVYSTEWSNGYYLDLREGLLAFNSIEFNDLQIGKEYHLVAQSTGWGFWLVNEFGVR